LRQVAISLSLVQAISASERKADDRKRQLELLTAELRELSLRDPVTRLHNKRYVYEFLSDTSRHFIKSRLVAAGKGESRNERSRDRVSGVFLVEVDGIRRVAEMHGQGASDASIVHVSRALKELVRESDHVIRWSHERFLVILEGSTRPFVASFPRRILDAVRSLYVTVPDGLVLEQRCTLGCSSLPLSDELPDLLNLDQTIGLCSLSLERARAQGRNCAVSVSLAAIPRGSVQEARDYVLRASADERASEDVLSFQLIR
jgi:diguanylate cyclase (GGDEF)-like protein